MQKHERWTDEEYKYLLSIKDNHTYKELADIMTSTFNQLFTPDAVRGKLRYGIQEPVETPQTPVYKETIKINADGSQESDRLVKISQEQSKDRTCLLKAHGYDPNEWEVVNAKSSIWNQHNKQDGTLTLYASKITVKPKETTINLDSLIKAIEDITPVVIHRNHSAPLSETHYINIPLFDMHFGISNFEYYKPTQSKILGKLDNRYKEVLFIIGQDLFHNDDFRGRTSSGREIDKVDMVKAWDDATDFYEPLIEKALTNSDKVKIIYSKGNHDETVGWAFVQMLKKRFPNATFDDSFRERKVHMLGLNFIGANHSDKKKAKNLGENFAIEFPAEWSIASTREVFTGHEHHEMLLVIDDSGIVIRRMPTRNKIDQYHEDKGYTTAHSRFMIFEYSEEELESIHYV